MDRACYVGDRSGFGDRVPVHRTSDRLSWRTAVAVCAAYAMLFHLLLAGSPAFGQFPQSDLAALSHHCATDARGASDDPSAPLPDGSDCHADCALCGLGHGALALPAEASLLPCAPWHVVERQVAVSDGIVPNRHEIGAKPRGPPGSA